MTSNAVAPPTRPIMRRGLAELRPLLLLLWKTGVPIKTTPFPASAWAAGAGVGAGRARLSRAPRAASSSLLDDESLSTPFFLFLPRGCAARRASSSSSELCLRPCCAA